MTLYVKQMHRRAKKSNYFLRKTKLKTIFALLHRCLTYLLAMVVLTCRTHTLVVITCSRSF